MTRTFVTRLGRFHGDFVGTSIRIGDYNYRVKRIRVKSKFYNINVLFQLKCSPSNLTIIVSEQISSLAVVNSHLNSLFSVIFTSTMRVELIPYSDNICVTFFNRVSWIVVLSSIPYSFWKTNMSIMGPFRAMHIGTGHIYCDNHIIYTVLLISVRGIHFTYISQKFKQIHLKGNVHQNLLQNSHITIHNGLSSSHLDDDTLLLPALCMT